MRGATEIDGHAFCLGIDSLESLYEARADLQSLIHSVNYLIKGAIFRPTYVANRSGRDSQDVCTLGELIDLYHTHEASKRHDKVYALLGMSTDDLSKAELLPDYGVPWKELLQRLAKYLLGEKISVETWDSREIAVIKSKGCILGIVSSIQTGPVLSDRQGVDIAFRNTLRQPGYMGKQRAHWTLQLSAKAILAGDLICLLEGASKPTIIRLCKDHFTIIMIAPTFSASGFISWPKLLQSVKTFTRDFLLVWDWDNSPEQSQDLSEYEIFTHKNSRVLGHSKTDLEARLVKATRTWDLALILGDSGDYEEARERLEEAIGGYETAFGEKQSRPTEDQCIMTPLSWAAYNGYVSIVNLLLMKDGVDPNMKDNYYGRTPLSWAAEGGHKAIVKLLLETGQVDVDTKDNESRTPLFLAAGNGHEAIVQLLLETGQVDVDTKDNESQTPLLWTARQGYEAIFKLLLETGQVDVDTEDKTSWTPLSSAAYNGHEAIVKLLLETGQADVNTKDDDSWTPLLWAAMSGHEAIVKLLLETGQVDVNAKDNASRTPLLWAAGSGHEAIVKLLLKTGQVDVNIKDDDSWTPLSRAADNGHTAIVELLQLGIA